MMLTDPCFRSEVERLQVVVRERGQELTCKDTESSSIIAQFTEANAELKVDVFT